MTLQNFLYSGANFEVHNPKSPTLNDLAGYSLEGQDGLNRINQVGLNYGS